MIIVNIDPSTKSGKHWILLYFDAEGHAENFDSLGNDVASYHSTVDIIVCIMLILDVRGCL